MTPALLCLPLMHKNMGCPIPSSLIDSIHYFWPGLPEPSKQHFTPHELPFAPKEAAACLKDIQGMGDAALSGVPLQAFITPQQSRAQLQDIQEQEALENFMQTGQGPAVQKEASLHELRQGQKLLLWAWLMEEHLLEVQRLTEDYSLTAAHLTSVLEAEKDDALAGLELIQNILSTDTFALPPWRLCLENMALFLPKESAAIINHPQLVEHIQENATDFNLSPLSDSTKSQYNLNEYEGQECTISLALLLQKDKGKISAPWFEKRLHCIIIKEKACLLQ